MTITVEAGVTYSIIRIDLSIAHDKEEIIAPGDVLSVIYLDGELDVSLDEPDAPKIEVDKIRRLLTKPAKWKYLYFTNTAQSGKSAILYVGREASFEVEPVPMETIAGEVGLISYPNAGYGNVSIGTTVGTIVSADTDRRALIIQNLGAGTLYIGFDSAVTTTNGFKLASGESLEINGYRGAVYGIGDATCDVRYLEIKK